MGCSVSLSADGKTILIGAYDDDKQGCNAGVAYVYRHVSLVTNGEVQHSHWLAQQYLTMAMQDF